MFRKFAQSRSGNFAVLSGIAIVPLCLAVGLAVDYSRHLSAQRHLQEMVDATSLSLAASREKDKAKLELLATDFLTGNQNVNRVQNLRLDDLKSTDDDIDIEVSGSIPTTFMALAGYETLNVRASALAERAVNGQVEVALILDNTYSMSDASTGTSRINTLKAAANKLANELLREQDGAARVAVVPYSDYVNIGIQNRNIEGVSVKNDYSETVFTPASCTEVTKETKCTQRAPNYTCTKIVDGIEVKSTCTGVCQKEDTTYFDPPKNICTEEKKTVRNYKFHGCMDSRIDHVKNANNRLHNNNPQIKYIGKLTTSSQPGCMTPLLELSSNRNTVKSAIDGMIIERSGYQPNTYIPTGLIWGWNVLSPEAPFTSAQNYDPANQRPRKVAVLMTDGENTMQFNSNGTHSHTTNATNLDKTNADTSAICSNMKAAGIEIFTIAFMVDDAAAKTMLEGCASDKTTHYFDASDSDKLLAAFEGIGNSLRVVRLAR